MFLCRKLCRTNQLEKVWSTNEMILIRDLRERAIRKESDLVRFGHVMQSFDGQSCQFLRLSNFRIFRNFFQS